jgi:signal peptidase II
VLVLAVVALALYATDQVTKVWAVHALTGEPDRPLVGTLLQLHLTRNPGAAFSTGTRFTEVFTVVAIAAVLVVLWLTRRLGNRFWAVALGLLLAGVAGNLTDRLVRSPGPLRGHVIDFLMLPSWPIFNVADMCINVAAALILVQAFRGVRLDGTRVADDEDPDDADVEPTDRHARAEQDTP